MNDHHDFCHRHYCSHAPYPAFPPSLALCSSLLPDLCVQTSALLLLAPSYNDWFGTGVGGDCRMGWAWFLHHILHPARGSTP